jgi:TrmH family RNA methyltransferase
VDLPPLPDLSNLVVVLVRPRNPLNIGAVARAMSNFGVRHLRLVNPYAVAFREAQSAVNAKGLLREAQEFNHVADAVADCSLVVGTTAVRNRALQHPLHRLDSSGASQIRKHVKRDRAALLFGSEKIGLTNDDFSHCHWLMHIATDPQHISMNLAQSVAVCLYELARAERSKAEPAKRSRNPATAAQTEQIARFLLESLRVSDYIKPGTDAVCEKKVRRLLLRLNIEQTDAEVLLGMVRQIEWKLRRGDNPKGR